MNIPLVWFLFAICAAVVIGIGIPLAWAWPEAYR